MFRSVFISQVFATHLTAVRGSRNVPGLGTAGELRPRAALALSAVAVSTQIAPPSLSNYVMQVERALTLWKEGKITIAGVEQDAHKGKNSAKGVSKGVNKATGKESITVLSFSNLNWGKSTSSYMKSINSLQERTWNKIIEHAEPFAVTAKQNAHTADDGDEDDSSDDVDERALLVNASDLDKSDH